MHVKRVYYFDEIPQVEELAKHYPYKRLKEYREISNQQLTELQLTSYRNFRYDEDIMLVASNGNETVGVTSISKLKWDTAHFEIDCYRLGDIVTNPKYEHQKRKVISFLLENVIENLQDKECLLMVRTDTTDIDVIGALIKNGFQLMDTTVKYAFDYRKSEIPIHKPQCILREYRESDLEDLQTIAMTFRENRFHFDKNLPSKKADLLYKGMITNACRGANDGVIVAEIDGRPVGFTTYDFNEDLNKKLSVRIGTLVFSAVSPESRGKQVYTSMIWQGLNIFKNRFDLLDLNTLVFNYAVQRAWMGLGFKIVLSRYTFHKWFKRE